MMSQQQEEIEEMRRKINQLPHLKQQYILIMLKLKVTKDGDTKKHKEYANALCVLLKFIINIDDHDILRRLAEPLESVLISYFFDQNDLILRLLNMDAYEEKHKNLLAINQKVEYYLNLNYVDFSELEGFKDTLFQV